MTIIEFKEKVYRRIFTQYMDNVRKEKLTLKDWLFFPIALSLPAIILNMAIYLTKGHVGTVYGFILFMIGLASGWTVFGVIIYLLHKWKNFVNFKKASDIFWGTTLLSIPILNDQELNDLIAKNDRFHCKKKYTHIEINQLFAFTLQEIDNMKSIFFNTEQKELIFNTVKSGSRVNFKNLNELIQNSDEYIEQQRLLLEQKEKQNIDDNQFLLEAINYKQEIEMEMDTGKIISINQKIKHLL